MSAKILAVDDSPSVRQLVRAALEADGYDVREAQNGQEALDALRTGSADLVLSDLCMPTMDGLTLLRALRQTPEHEFTPVLLLTTENGEAMKRRGRAAGASGWLVKPFRPEQLRQVVARTLDAARARALESVAVDREGARPPGLAGFGDHDDITTTVTDVIHEPRHVDPQCPIRTSGGGS